MFYEALCVLYLRQKCVVEFCFGIFFFFHLFFSMNALYKWSVVLFFSRVENSFLRFSTFQKEACIVCIPM